MMPRLPLLPVRLLFALSPRVEPFTRPSLIVAPHQDDETFGCGGVIAHKRANNVPVQVVFLTDGSRSHGALEGAAKLAHITLRQEEARAALALLGVPASDITFLDLPDGSLSQIHPEDREHTIEDLQNLMEVMGVGEVFVTYRRDRHKDHEASFALTAEAITRRGKPVDLYEYPIWVCHLLSRWLQRVGLRTILRARYVPLSKPSLTKKRAAAAAHASQHETLPPGFADLFLTGKELFFVSRLGETK